MRHIVCNGPWAHLMRDLARSDHTCTYGRARPPGLVSIKAHTECTAGGKPTGCSTRCSSAQGTNQ